MDENVGIIVSCNCCQCSFMMDWRPQGLLQHTVQEMFEMFALVAHFNPERKVSRRMEDAFAAFQSVPLTSCSKPFQQKMDALFKHTMEKARRIKSNSRKQPIVQLLLLPMLMEVCDGNKEQVQRTLEGLYYKQGMKFVEQRTETLQFLLDNVQTLKQAVHKLQTDAPELSPDHTALTYMQALLHPNKLLQRGLAAMYECLVEKFQKQVGDPDHRPLFFYDSHDVAAMCSCLTKRFDLVQTFLEAKLQSTA